MSAKKGTARECRSSDHVVLRVHGGRRSGVRKGGEAEEMDGVEWPTCFAWMKHGDVRRCL